MCEFRRVTILSVLGVVIIFLIVALTKVFNAPKKADADSCALYQIIYETDVLRWADDGNKIVIKPLTIPDSDVLDWGSPTPKMFVRYTGEVEKVFSELTGETEERAITEEFGYDVTSFFTGEFPTHVMDIQDCFSNIDNGPRLEDVDYKTIMDYEKHYAEEGAVFFTQWKFSTPVFSKNGLVAITYIESYCGGLCGDGYYILFEKIDDRWKSLGVHLLWVS